ncbi:ATP-binding protein [Planosporangium sp. 12N6]|uniref:ATP-binding protein n=1 Tax=Planosporangium spinosum TaxID=3402278 RepID=UPI003CF01AA2
MVTGGPVEVEGAAAPPGPQPLPFVGRESELFRLGAAWGSAARGRPGLVLLAGAAGIGKTRVARETVRLARDTGGAVLWARCQGAERSLLLQPFVEAIGAHAAQLPPDLLRRLAGQRAATLAALVPGVASVLGPVLTTPASRAVRQRLAGEAVTGFLAALAAHQPVLLVLDDLHDAAASTVALLRELVTGTGTRLLAVATVRAPEGGAVLDPLAGAATRLDLGPLSPPAVTRLATEAGWGDRAAEIRAGTGGNPLFVVEALRALAAGAPRPPESLEAAVLARLGRVDAGTERIVRAAAVLGVTVDPATLARLVDLPLPATAAHCEAALSGGLFVAAEGGYEFGHDVVREVLYATTPAPTRDLHHRRAAELLDHRPEAMAAHAAAVGDWPRAARGWLLAGAEAARLDADVDAEALLVRAVDAGRRAGEAGAVARAEALLRQVRDGG